MKTTSLIALALLTCAGISQAKAEESLAFGAGFYNVFDNTENSTWLTAEYRGKYLWNNLQPIFGTAGNFDGALYFFGGLAYDWKVGNNLYVVPSLAAGLYGQGDSKDLGGAIEFRSSIELAYRFDNDMRLGVQLQHLSNASIYDKNPGTEMLMVNYTIPLMTLAR
jgi:lipid A 3-O-deacylase